MKTDIETKYCQTCGIPLNIDYNNLEANTTVKARKEWNNGTFRKADKRK